MVGDGVLTGISADPWFMPGISADIVGDSELAGTSDGERIAATPTAPATATKMADITRRWVLLVMVRSFPRWGCGCTCRCRATSPLSAPDLAIPPGDSMKVL